MCCCFSDEPVQDTKGKIKTWETANKFQLDAPLKDGCSTLLWFCGQFIPCTCGITQYFLRRKVLQNDMSRYECCQGYMNCCCFTAGQCGEKSCPDLCLCIEAHLCNNLAITSSRWYIMDRYSLSSDPCDYRIIAFNNCIQMLACVCDILAIFFDQLRAIADCLDLIAHITYHTVSGCMTAQVSYEMDFQSTKGPEPAVAYAAPAPPVYAAGPTPNKF